MTVKQIYTIVNSISEEILGKTDIVQEDLTGIVDLGTEVLNANAMDNYVRKLVNHIGRMIFVDRAYAGSAPSVLRDGWEYGSIVEKIQAELPEATENESWELTDGETYNPNVFHKPDVSAKFFNSKTTFEIDMSFTERQVKESFDNATQLNAFMSMIHNEIEKSLTIKVDGLVMRTINNFIGELIADKDNGIRKINLLDTFGDSTLTADKAITNPEFIRHAAYMISLYSDRMTKISRLFNIGKMARFTPKDLQHIIMLSDFQKAASVYLQSDTYHNELVALPNAETVPYWQAPSKSYTFANVSSINLKTSGGKTVSQSGILCAIFDRDAVAVCNEDRRVTSHYNPKGEFFNEFWKYDCSYLNDLNEQGIVFVVEDKASSGA